jgi:hypothetical protein
VADLTITAANVLKGDSAVVVTNYNAGESITAGQVVYLKSTDSEWYKAQCDGTAEESGYGVTVGVALHASGNGQPLAVQTGGQITIGATTVATTNYVVSDTAGGIAPHADLSTAGWYYTRVGHAISTTVIQLNLLATGVAKA